MVPRSIAHYEIVEKIGAGGMGEVWRARDSKLGRDVALKLIPEELSGDSERMSRFAREAQVLASLNHPNIAAIYGIENSDESKVLVLELVEGPTLQDRIKKGAIPLTESLEVARQIAEAVHSAHERGVIHRDLKPANVKITTDGQVKVLDFGLAKAIVTDEVSGSTPSLSLSPTISNPMTAANMILGTAAYMSPEQARGKPVDKRADIWSFGVILFEMLTGRSLFRGETISDTMAEVLKTVPDWESLPKNTPIRIRRLIRRCLTRDPRQRLQDIGDARILIEETLAGDDDDVQPVATARGGGAGRIIAAAILAALIGGAAAWFLKPSPPETTLPLRKFLSVVPEGTRDVAISPDGTMLAYVQNGLMVRELDQLSSRRLVEEDNINVPFWSPDGMWIGYGHDKDLYKVRVTGGEPAKIGTIPDGHSFEESASAHWQEDGKIVYSTGYYGLYEVASQGGESTLLLEPGQGIRDFHEMIAIPGLGALVFIVHLDEGGSGTLRLWDGTTKSNLYTTPDGARVSDLAYSPTGHLVFTRGGSSRDIWALPFDAGSLEVTGEPFLVQSRGVESSVSRDGTLSFIRTRTGDRGKIVQVDRAGKIKNEIGSPEIYWGALSVSSDEEHILVAKGTGMSQEIWNYDIGRGSSTRITTDDYRNDFALWGPDEKEIYFYTNDPMNIYARQTDGTGELRELGPGALPYPSPDGKYLAYSLLKPDIYDWDIWVRSLEDESAEPWPLVQSAGRDWWSPISQNGEYALYTSENTGPEMVYATTFPHAEKHWAVSVGPGEFPLWRDDGREVYYMVGDSIMAVPVTIESELSFGVPTLLFRRELYRWPNVFDVSPDGESFYFIVPADLDKVEPRALVVVQNWIAEFETDTPK